MFPLKNTEAYIHANGFRSTLGKELADRDAEINELGSEIQALANQLTSDVPTTVDFTSVINLTDALGVNAKDVKVKIEAVQSGSGTPSPTNIRPITGFSNAVLTVNGETVTISLGNTVYGGLLDVTSGVLTIDRAIAIVDGDVYTLNYGGAFDTGIVEGRITISDKKPGYTNFTANEFEVYQYGDNPTVYGQTKGSPTSSNIWFTLPSTITSKSDLVTWLTSNPIQIVYELATPTTVQLTPTQIQLLQGNNTISADSGDVSIQYFKELNIGGAVAELQTAVNDLAQDKIDLASLQTVVAASSDFADFQTRIASL